MDKVDGDPAPLSVIDTLSLADALFIIDASSTWPP